MIIPQHQRDWANASAKISKLFLLRNELERAGKAPIDLTLGNPLDRPSALFYQELESLTRSLKCGDHNPHRYMPNQGYLETRDIVARHISERVGLTFRAEDIWMIAGCANGLDISLASLLAPNQEVILFTPGFMEYTRYIVQNQGVARAVKCTPDWGLDLEKLNEAITPQTQAIILNYPNNPTGRVLADEEYRQLATCLTDWSRQRDRPLIVLEDSPYDQLVFGVEASPTLLKYYPHTLYMTSLSKSHGLAGERLGYLALHPDWGTASERSLLATVLTNQLRCRVINAPALMQRLLARVGPRACIDLDAVELRLRTLERALVGAGFRLKPAGGSFYAFAQFPDDMDWSSWSQWAHNSEEPILAVPGTFFGGPDYASYLRFSVTVPMDDIQRACRRLITLCQRSTS